jgi:nucleoid DNA-binding protein
MKTLTKTYLAALVVKSARQAISQGEAVDLIETLMDLLVCHFQNGGEKVTLRGFGTFKLRKRRAFTGSNPNTGAAIQIPEALSITFKPGAETLRRLNLK